MSATIRQELADAASTVFGVECSPFYVQLTAPGAACVRRDRIDFPDRFGGVGFWNVVVCLGQDLTTAELLFEDLAAPLVAALRPVMAIKSASLNTTSFPDGTAPVLTAFINGFREE